MDFQLLLNVAFSLKPPFYITSSSHKRIHPSLKRFTANLEIFSWIIIFIDYLLFSSKTPYCQGFKPWLASLINSSWLVFYFCSVQSAMNIDYCDRKYWTYIFLLIYLWRDHQIQLGHFLELFKAMNIDYCDQRLENAAFPSVKRSKIHLGLFPVGLH